MAKVSFTVDVDTDDLDAVTRQIKMAIGTVQTVKSVTTADTDAATALLDTMARMDIFADKSIREAVNEYGLTQVSDIIDHVEADQADIDWLQSQDDTLQSLIIQARGITGIDHPEALEDRIRCHPDFISNLYSAPEM